MEKTYRKNALRDNFLVYVLIQIFTIQRRVLMMASGAKLLLRGSEKKFSGGNENSFSA